MGAAALLVASGCPRAPLPQPPLARPGVGPGPGGRHPDRVPRRRHRRPDRPALLPQRPADPARLPRRRGELPLGRLHGHPRPAGPDAGHDDLRRRARAVPPTCASASSSRAPSGCRRGCARWSRRSTPSPATRSGSRQLSLRPERVRAPPDAVHARTPPRTWAGSSSRPAPTSCLFTTDYPHVEGGRRPRRALRGVASATPIDEADRDRFYRAQLRRPHGRRPPAGARFRRLTQPPPDPGETGQPFRTETGSSFQRGSVRRRRGGGRRARGRPTRLALTSTASPASELADRGHGGVDVGHVDAHAVVRAADA